MRAKILDEALPHVPFDGWSDKTLREAAERVGASDAELKAAFPRGPVDAIVAFSLWFVVLIAAVCYFVAGITTPKSRVISP